MEIVNLPEATSSLSLLVDAIESGREVEIILMRNGRPAARLVPLGDPSAGQRLGVAKGAFEVPDDIDAHNDDVARLFGGHAAR